MDDQKIYFQNKKTVISFILSLLVFYIHFRAFSVFRKADGFLEYALDQLLILTKVAVPLFFAMSGALFYRDYRLKLTVKKWKSRVVSLCIPYLCWNTIWLILSLLGHYTPLGMFLGGVNASLSLENVLKGIFLYGYFEPFWFLLQLIVLTLCCPVIYLLLKNKWLGLAGIFAFYLALCSGFQLNAVLFPDSEMVIFYLIGAWIGIHYFPAFTSRKSRKHAFIGVLIYILCCVFHGTVELHPDWLGRLQIPLIVTVISCGAFWIAFDYFDTHRCPRYMHCSFLIYALHSFVGAVISRLLNMVLPSGSGGLLLTAVIAFPFTVAVICIIDRILDHYFPRLKRILTGRP